MYIVYKNKYNEVKPYSLEVRAENEEYIDAIDLIIYKLYIDDNKNYLEYKTYI